jgi:hypothetical protein
MKVQVTTRFNTKYEQSKDSLSATVHVKCRAYKPTHKSFVLKRSIMCYMTSNSGKFFLYKVPEDEDSTYLETLIYLRGHMAPQPMTIATFSLP